MKFTLAWLKDYLDTEINLHQLAETLTSIGLEVEDIDTAAQLKPFIIAEILEAAPHPQADKLQILKVAIGEESPLQIVCGAKNARQGLKSVLAPIGTYIPALDFKIGKSKIRNVESYGMMCSAAELGLPDVLDGIIELPKDAPVGKSFSEYTGLDDPVIDVAVTPNRGDWSSVYGIARDLAAKGAGNLKPLTTPSMRLENAPLYEIELADEASRVCLAFSYRSISNVENTSSPLWMQQRLSAIGLHPISALVDITNYLTFAVGRPLHVFDADKIEGKIVIRPAKEGEIFHALNGKEYTLSPEHIVLADKKGVLSLAGIMGGERAACTQQTQNILVESALWDAKNIAQTGRQLNIISDARYRFERGLDPSLVQTGLDLACEMMLKHCGGQASLATHLCIYKQEVKKLSFSLSQIQRFSSLNIAPLEVRNILNKLGFHIVEDKAETLTLIIPSWRHDITQQVDIVEEIIRIYGIEKITPRPLLPLTNPVTPKILPPLLRFRKVKTALAARGLCEVCNFSFISQEKAEHFGGGSPSLQITNPLTSELTTLRPSLLPQLFEAAQKNAAHARTDCGFFEVSHIYLDTSAEGQKNTVAGLRSGSEKLQGSGRFWRESFAMVDVFDSKEDAFCVLESCGLNIDKIQVEQGGAPAWFHPTRSGTLKLGSKIVLGYFGEFHPKTLNFMKVKGKICGFEIFLDALPETKNKTKTKPALPPRVLQPIKRDFAFLLDKFVPAHTIIQAAMQADHKLITEVTIFDIFEDKSLGEMKKSLAIEVTLQPLENSLTDAEIDQLSNKIIKNILQTTGGALRS